MWGHIKKSAEGENRVNQGYFVVLKGRENRIYDFKNKYQSWLTLLIWLAWTTVVTMTKRSTIFNMFELVLVLVDSCSNLFFLVCYGSCLLPNSDFQC